VLSITGASIIAMMIDACRRCAGGVSRIGEVKCRVVDLPGSYRPSSDRRWPSAVRAVPQAKGR
jgi:hypothetical protein